jgi:hypothetical protein
VYLRPEDEYFHKHATWSFTFPVAERVVRKGELQPLRLVMLLSRSNFTLARCVSPSAKLMRDRGRCLPPDNLMGDNVTFLFSSAT